MTTAQGRQLARAFDRFLDELERELAKATDDEADQVAADERSWVPVLTGELRDGIDVKKVSVGPDRLARVGIFDSTLWWAIYIEYGRKNADAQPFVLPAYTAARRRYPRRVRRTVQEVVRRAQR